MSTRVNLPPGCSGFQVGGTHYEDRPGGHVDVADHDAPAVNRMLGNGDAGLLSAKGRHYIGTKKGRRCTGCGRLWNVWSLTCPREVCGAPTEPEAD
jgi:hypothetical protein